MSHRKIFCTGKDNTLSNWMDGTICLDPYKADFVVFRGGMDINPALYGETPHAQTNFSTSMDNEDIEAFNIALERRKPLVGICRGAQFLCAKAGGKLVQDQQQGIYQHGMWTYDGKSLTVNSAHHQAMYPWNLPKDEFKVLGWTSGLADYHHDSANKEMIKNNPAVPLEMELEMAFFPKIRALCIQFHPEWLQCRRTNEPLIKETMDYMTRLLDKFLAGDDFKEAANVYL